MGYRVWSFSALSVILLIAFGLLLISVLSVPVTKVITLCTYGGIQFGVFGYCDTKSGACSPVRIGYGNVTSINGFSLPSNARHTLSSLLIVHVVAAGMTLILLLFTLLAHFRRFRSSSGYLLFILIFSLPCFLVSLLAFLVDILLFVPHLDWGGWIVLGSTVLIAIFGVFLCVLRRTASSKKTHEHQKMDNSETQPFGQYDNGFSGGVSYKPTANSGDLIFANSIDAYKSNDSLPRLGEAKYETNVSNHTARTDEDAPLTRHVQNRPISEYMEPPDVPAHNQSITPNGPSPTRDHRYEDYTRSNNRQNNVPMNNYSQPPDNHDYSEYPSNQAAQYSSTTPSNNNNTVPNNQPHPYREQISGNEDPNQLVFTENFAKNNRPPSLVSGIMPAGTYISPQPSGHFNQYPNIYSVNPGNTSTTPNNSEPGFQPGPDHHVNIQNPPTHPTPANVYAPSHSSQPLHSQPHHQYPNPVKTQNASTQSAANRQPLTIDETKELPFHAVNHPSPQSAANNEYENYNNSEFEPPLSIRNQNSNLQQPYSSSEISSVSRNSIKNQQPPSHQINSIKASQRHDLLLNTNPDFQIANRSRASRAPKNKTLAASALNDLGDSGPYGISRKQS